MIRALFFCPAKDSAETALFFLPSKTIVKSPCACSLSRVQGLETKIRYRFTDAIVVKKFFDFFLPSVRIAKNPCHNALADAVRSTVCAIVF